MQRLLSVVAGFPTDGLRRRAVIRFRRIYDLPRLRGTCYATAARQAFGSVIVMS